MIPEQQDNAAGTDQDPNAKPAEDTGAETAGADAGADQADQTEVAKSDGSKEARPDPTEPDDAPDPPGLMTNEDMLVDQLRKLAAGEISREQARQWLAEQYPD